MKLTGKLTEFSWHDLLDLVAHQRLNGWLGVEAMSDRSPKCQYQVWFQEGYLIAATQSTRRTNELFWLMQHQGWLSYNSALKIAQHCSSGMAVGQYFRQQGVLNNQKLQHLFNLQLVPVLSSLSRFTDAEFTLDTTLPLAYEHMTGLKLLAYDAQSISRQVAIAC